jgi:excisionase family DNA binding protein
VGVNKKIRVSQRFCDYSRQVGQKGREMKPLKTHEIAKRLDCSQRTIRRLLDEGKLPGFKIGGTWRVKVEEMQEILQKRHTKSDKSDDPT